MTTLEDLKKCRDNHKVDPQPYLEWSVDEIERLRKTLTDHGINPDSEYIAPGGLRVDPPSSKTEPEF